MLTTEKPKVVGERSEACVLAALLKAGKVVLLPFGDNQRYDLVIDEGGTFRRIQCKTGRLNQGRVSFLVTSKSGGKARKGYHGQIDLFGVYCPETDKVYLVPFEDVCSNRNYVCLRVDALRPNAPQARVRWAREYEI